MDFKEILKKVTKGNLLLGNLDEELNINIKDVPSIIITGETGSGKSILLDQIILELINTHTSLEMGIINIDTSGVELNLYNESEYSLFSSINDLDKAEVVLSRILKEIERRKKLIKEVHVTNVYDYNKISNTLLPLIVIAIDDDKLLLRREDINKMLKSIISNLSGLNMFLCLATSDVYNDFFETDENTFASMLITFDYTTKEESINNNITGSENLAIGEFLAKYKGEIKKYRNYEFNDNIIKEVLNIN